MRVDNWMPLYIADYLRDTMHLNTEQHGAYILLIMAAWNRGGDLPGDDAQLAGVARMPLSAWRRIRPIMSGFFVVTPETWEHKRVRAERDRAQNLSEKRRETGAKGGRPKKETGSKEKPIGSDLPSQTKTPQEGRVTTSFGSTIDSSDTSVSGLKPDDGEKPDPDAQAWSLAVAVLTKQGGLSEKQARAFFGGLLKRNGMKASELLVPLIHAEDAGTLDPQSYLVQSAQNVRSPAHERPFPISDKLDRRQASYAQSQLGADIAAELWRRENAN
jgi:uncharacterized protein YdaU (DUF1376 family)